MQNIIYIFAYIGISYILYLMLYFSMLWREYFEKKHYNTDYCLGIAIGGFSINALSHIIAGICIITILPFAMASLHSWMRLRNDKKKPPAQEDSRDFIQRFKDDYNDDFEQEE